jgi:5-methylcytosine-specific restriction endonuclease McrA
MTKPKLTVELVPSTSFYTNVRSILPTSEWDRLRKASYKKAKFKCQICKESGLDQGFRHALECHEIWEYKKDGTQLLKGLISLCPKCHQVKHIGRTIAIGKKKQAYAHIAKVNKWDKAMVEAYIGSCFQEHKERSKIKWKLNIGILTEKHGVKKTLIDAGLRKKTLGQPTWKRKKKRKKAKKKVVARKKRPTKKK